jgi:hypothetical protein
MALDKRAWLRQLGVATIPDAGADAAGAVQPMGAADGKAPVITVKSNGDGTFTINGRGFLANELVMVSAAGRTLDRDYGTIKATDKGLFTFLTRNICPSPPPITFTATSGINSKTDRTDWVWSNTVATASTDSTGSGMDGGGGADGGDGGTGAIIPTGSVGSDGGAPPQAAAPVGIPRLTDEQLEKIVGTDTGVTHDQAQRALTDFLEQLQQAQRGKSLKIDDKVRLAGDALSKGLGDTELQIYGVLQDDRVNVEPKELADKVAKLLPDKIPRPNFDAFLKLKPQPIKPPEQLSLSGAIAKLLTPAVKEIVSGLSKDIRDKIVNGIQGAVEKGLVAIADQAMSNAKLDDQTKKAILSAVVAAIKEKPGQPGDRQQPQDEHRARSATTDF